VSEKGESNQAMKEVTREGLGYLGRLSDCMLRHLPLAHMCEEKTGGGGEKKITKKLTEE